MQRLRQQCVAQVSRRWLSGNDGAKDVPSRLYTFEDVRPSPPPLPFPFPPSPILKSSQVNILTSKPDTSRILVDVREPSEFSSGTIPGALNIPVSSQPDALLLPEEEFEDRFGFPKPDSKKEIVFFCKAGVRSRAAAQIAKTAGYEHVGEFPGSWNEWFSKGGKVEHKK